MLRNDKFEDIVTLEGNNVPQGYRNLLKPLIRNGKIVREEESVDIVRERVMSNLKRIPEYLKDILQETSFPVKFIPKI